jgi:hypothetical protein
VWQWIKGMIVCYLQKIINFVFNPHGMENRLEPAGDAGRRLQIDPGCANAAKLAARPMNGQ